MDKKTYMLHRTYTVNFCHVHLCTLQNRNIFIVCHRLRKLKMQAGVMFAFIVTEASGVILSKNEMF